MRFTSLAAALGLFVAGVTAFSTSRTSLTPDVTADSSSNTRPDCLATM